MDASSIVGILCERYGLARPKAVELASAFRPFSFSRGSIVARAGERDTTLYFVTRGVLRLFSTDRMGRERNKAFVSDGMFYVALSAHLNEKPSAFGVHALEDVCGVSMAYAEFEQRVDTDIDMARLWRRYMQAHFVRHEARELVLQTEDASGRYAWFLAQHPGLIDRVPLYHVASYLGLTNVTLSRVRRARRS